MVTSTYFPSGNLVPHLGRSNHPSPHSLYLPLARTNAYHYSFFPSATHGFITRCAYAQGRVKRLSPSIYMCVYMCMCHKNTAVCCLTARKSPRNSSLPLGLAIYILRKMPRKPDESSVEYYGHGFLIAARPRGVSYRTLR